MAGEADGASVSSRFNPGRVTLELALQVRGAETTFCRSVRWLGYRILLVAAPGKAHKCELFSHVGTGACGQLLV